MTWALIIALTGLAVADSLNPFTVAAQAYLLGTPRPMARSLAFLLTTYVVYAAGGVLLLEGWSAFYRYLAPLIPSWGLSAGEIALGLLLAGATVWAWRKARNGTPFSPPAQMTISATIVFAVVSTAADFSSALPYFAAVNRLAGSDTSRLAQLGAIGWYNLIYVAPLILLVGAKLALSDESSAAVFGRARTIIDWCLERLLLPLMALASAALIVDGVRRLAIW